MELSDGKSAQPVGPIQFTGITIAEAKTLGPYPWSLAETEWLRQVLASPSPSRLPTPTPSQHPHAYLLHVKPVELVCNALKLSGNLYLCSMLPRPFWGLLPKGQACRETGREREPVACVACKDRGPTSQHSPQLHHPPRA